MTDSDNGDNKRSGKKRGFGAMDPEKQRQISSLGGRAVHASGKRHAWTEETAREAGRLGGLAAARKKALEEKTREEGDAS